MLILAMALLAAGLLATAAATACLANLWTSDAAGNGLAQVYTLAFMAVQWALVASASAASVWAGWLPGWAKLGVLVLVPAAAAGAVAGFAGMVGRGRPRWPMVPLAAAPAALVAAGVQAAWSAPGEVFGGEGPLRGLLAVVAAAALSPWAAVLRPRSGR